MGIGWRRYRSERGQDGLVVFVRRRGRTRCLISRTWSGLSAAIVGLGDGGRRVLLGADRGVVGGAGEGLLEGVGLKVEVAAVGAGWRAGFVGGVDVRGGRRSRRGRLGALGGHDVGRDSTMMSCRCQ